MSRTAARKPRTRLMSVLRLAVAAVVATGLSTLAACGGAGNHSGLDSDGGDSSKTITIGQISWTEDLAVTAVWKRILEKKGYTVHTKLLDSGPLFTGIANGDLDAWFDVWLPNGSGSYWKKFKDKVHDVGVWYSPADLGIAVPDYVDAQSLADLGRDASEFDGTIVGIEASAGEMVILKNRVMPAYKLKKHGVKLTPSSTPAMLGSLKTAIQKHEPVAVVMWHPHWAFNKYNIRYLKDPKHAWGEPDKLHTITSKDFASSHPKVERWFKNFHLTAKQLQGLEGMRQKAGDSNAAQTKATAKWVQQNKAVWKKWVS
ncbi:MAG: glycine betaine ABC transporter substrate-binding protein [Nocardioidaceae bacterium]